MNYAIQNLGERGELSVVTCFCSCCAFSKLDPSRNHFIRNKIQALVNYIKASLHVPLKSFCTLLPQPTKPKKKSKWFNVIYLKCFQKSLRPLIKQVKTHIHSFFSTRTLYKLFALFQHFCLITSLCLFFCRFFLSSSLIQL